MSDNSRRDLPLNTPFADLARRVKKTRRTTARAERAEPKASPQNVAAAASAAPSEFPAAPPEQPVDGATLFAEAVSGARAIDHAGDRVRRVEAPDLASIERGRRDDLQALERAEGFDVSYSEHFVRARSHGVSRETLSELERGRFAIKAHIDLHRLTFDEATVAVDEFLRRSQLSGHRAVLVITGKGLNSPSKTGVLRERIPHWLARGPSSRRVLAFVTARVCDGGDGALYVLLRTTSSRKNHIDLELGGVGALDV